MGGRVQRTTLLPHVGESVLSLTLSGQQQLGRQHELAALFVFTTLQNSSIRV